MSGAGGMKDRFQFQQRAADANGDRLGEWEPAFPNQAGEVTRLQGTEPVMAMRLQGIQPVVIRVRSSRWTRSLTTDHRALDVRAGAEYAITSVTPDKTGQWIDVMASTGGTPA